VCTDSILAITPSYNLCTVSLYICLSFFHLPYYAPARAGGRLSANGLPRPSLCAHAWLRTGLGVY